jgi:hypothetical protein
MADFYVIVHADASTLEEDIEVAREIERIRREELHADVMGNPCEVDYAIPPHDNLLVCGFFHGRQEWDHRCVDEQIKALKRRGLDPALYLPATVSLDP